jgi:hypothetical protein
MAFSVISERLFPAILRCCYAIFSAYRLDISAYRLDIKDVEQAVRFEFPKPNCPDF